jgi:hypothetical protein
MSSSDKCGHTSEGDTDGDDVIDGSELVDVVEEPTTTAGNSW